jgi:hypothetical protein
MPTGQKRDRKADKRRRYLREAGRPSLITPEELAAVKARVARLHAEGMSYPQIAAVAGVQDSSVACLISGWRGRARGEATGMRRTTYDAIMRVTYQPPTDGRYGARMGAIGTVRRLQALVAHGFSLDVIAQHLGDGLDERIDRTVLGKIVRQQRSTSFVHAQMHYAVMKAYEKLRDMDPRDMQSPYATGRALGSAKRHGYVAPGYWDDDTIDDPNAFPEYTGFCGQVKGILIHLRDDIPICDYCQTTLDKSRSRVNPFELYDMYVNQGMNSREIGAEFHVRADLISKYATVLIRRHILTRVNEVEMVGFCEICGSTRLRTAGQRNGTSKIVCYAAVAKFKDKNRD